METNSQLASLDPEVLMLQSNKESGYNYRSRRSEKWTQNYELYRDTIQTNRLTMRQSVHVPFMKMELQTILKDIDDMPTIYFENLDNDKQKEIFINKYWEEVLRVNKAQIKDIVDKKQEMFFGRSFMQIQIIDGMVRFLNVDPEDILVDRYVDPTDLDTSRFLIHTHIFMPLSKLEANPEYDQEAIKDLKIWYGTEAGLIKAAENAQQLDEKQKRMADLGVLDAYDPVVGETIVELSLHFVYRDNEKDSENNRVPEQLYIYVEAENMKKLMKKPLEEFIGPTEDHYWRNHFPYDSWAEDVEIQDFWSDGKADTLRPVNQILDVFYSQLLENRTLRSFNMFFYNSSLEGYDPTTWQPVPFGQYGVPLPANGDIRANMQRVEIPDLSESIDEMKYVQEMGERAVGATTTQQGAVNENKVTLGEVELAVSEGRKRTKGISKFYTLAWQNRAEKFLKFLEACPEKLDTITLYANGRNDSSNVYSADVSPADYAGKYRVKVWSQEEKDEEALKNLEKMGVVVTNMPGNDILLDLYHKSLLEFAKVPPDKAQQILELEKQKRAQQAAMIAAGLLLPDGTAPNAPKSKTPSNGAKPLPVAQPAKPQLMA